mmetsp:Transcript_15448/g.25759  ORF Transcript_15448/g.25759 Transcript_15448/m.25759 type:complete len:86 (+) Transcript_15448:80-337(+)
MKTNHDGGQDSGSTFHPTCTRHTTTPGHLVFSTLTAAIFTATVFGIFFIRSLSWGISHRITCGGGLFRLYVVFQNSSSSSRKSHR